MKSLDASGKINLSLVVGPQRPDGKHEVATVLQRIDLADRISLGPASELEISGFPKDTLVRDALLALASAAGIRPNWSVRIEKRVPVAAGLGGGSSDAAAALRLGNDTLPSPLPAEQLHQLAADLGADVPFFLTTGTQVGTGDGSELEAVDLPRDYVVLLLLPAAGERKAATADIYAAFDGAEGFGSRRAALVAAVERRDLTALPRNDLASSPLARDLSAAGAFRADVSGAGPAVYGLFAAAKEAEAAREALAGRGETWLARPAW
jgi:4-diphosphocytidyl-2-C-methyl-D-erythritol kinase